MIEAVNDRSALSRWILFAALTIFLVVALNFFNFFVDDEAIPLVYAQNLIRGRGLPYAAVEGRIEATPIFSTSCSTPCCC